jgi:hypothetical protein
MLEKPITVPLRHLLGAVGTGVLGFRHPGQARVEAARRANPRHPELIDGFVLGLLKRARAESTDLIFVRREALAAHLEVPEHFVSQALERLNKRGILGPESNELPHDIYRGEPESHSGWTGSIRYVNTERLDSLLSADATTARAARP